MFAWRHSFREQVLSLVKPESSVLNDRFSFSVSFSPWILAGIRSPMGSLHFTTIISLSKSSRGRSPRCSSSSSCWQSVTRSWRTGSMVSVAVAARTPETGFSFFSWQGTRAWDSNAHEELCELEVFELGFNSWHVFILYPREVPGLRGFLQGDLPSRSWILFPTGRSLP